MQNAITHRVPLILALLCCIFPFAAVQLRPTTSAAPQPEPTALSASFDAAFTIPILMQEGIVEMDLHTYLTGVLAAETPADFSAEAIKAQAVASRTFALQQGSRDKHAGAYVCTDTTCCQGWSDPTDAPPVYAQCAEATDGLVITYNDALIEATFFSCSGGQTEAAVAVWGSDVPYLQSVSSPGEENAPRFTETVAMEAAIFAQTLQAENPSLLLPADPSQWFGAVTYTPGGGIDTIQIGSSVFTGTVLRKLLGLRSTDITFSVEGGTVHITTQGYGHRVGLSQYGAQAMAIEGADYEEILLHYYQGTKIKRLSLSEQP